jgi:hypothetical protein
VLRFCLYYCVFTLLVFSLVNPAGQFLYFCCFFSREFLSRSACFQCPVRLSLLCGILSREHRTAGKFLASISLSAGRIFFCFPSGSLLKLSDFCQCSRSLPQSVSTHGRLPVDSAPVGCSHSVWRVPGLMSLSARPFSFSLCRQKHSAGHDLFRTRACYPGISHTKARSVSATRSGQCKQ